MTVLPLKEMLNFLTSMMFSDDLVITKDILTFLLHLCFILGRFSGILSA